MIVNLLGGIVTSWLDGKKKRQEAKQEQEIESIRAGREERSNGWKDEYALLIISIPYLMAFVPALQPYIKQGFEVLATSTPEWWQYVFVGGMCAALGIKLWNGFRK